MMLDQKIRAEKERMRLNVKTKTEHTRMSEEIKRLNFELNLSIDNNTKANILVKQLTSET